MFSERVLFEDIDDICFSSQNVGETSLIFYICLRNVDGNFHRHFLSIEDTENVLLLLAKRRWKISTIFYIYFQNVDGNFTRHFACHLISLESARFQVKCYGL